MCRVVRCVGSLILFLAGPVFSQETIMREVIFAQPSPKAADQAKQAASVAGKVIDASGQPVSQAKVALAAMKWSEGDGAMKTESEQQGLTGPGGAFSFDVVRPAENEYRWMVVTVDKPGLAWGWSSLSSSDKMESQEIRLTQPKSIAGTVADEAGRPMAGAQVTLASAVVPGGENGRSFGGDLAERLFAASTDAQGRFRFDRLPADASVDLQVSKPGRATLNTGDARTVWTGTLQYSAGKEDIQIQLPPEARIAGVVVEKESGKPVSAVKVEVTSRDGGRIKAGAAVTVKGDGTFAFGGLGAGTYVVRCTRQTNDWAPCSQEVTLQAGKASPVRMELVKGGLLEVTVKEEGSGRPLATASVQVSNAARSTWASGATDANGLARIRLTAGQYLIDNIRSSDYSMLRPNEQISLEDGKTVSYQYTMSRQPKVRGTVLDPDRRPLEGVKVQVYPRGSRDEVTSDAQGRFEMLWDPTPWGEPIQSVIVAMDEKRNLAGAKDLDAETGQVELQIGPAFTLSGRIVDPNRNPIAKAQLYAMLRHSSWGSTIGSDRRVGSDGRFSVAALPQGYGYEVMVRAEGFGQTRTTVNQEEVSASPKDLGDLQLAVANLSVSGVVVDSNDVPLAGVQVSTYGEGQPEQHGLRTDSNGRFVLKACEGVVRISANTNGTPQMYGSAQTTGGATDVKIVVSSRGTSSRAVARPIRSLKGKSLPDLKTLGVQTPDVSGKPLLVCLIEMDQRPSRRCLADLAKKAETLAAKGVSVAVVQVSKADLGQYQDWLKTNQVSWPIRTVEADFEAVWASWGVKALPWLVLTDSQHTVKAEGFAITDLGTLVED